MQNLYEDMNIRIIVEFKYPNEDTFPICDENISSINLYNLFEKQISKDADVNKSTPRKWQRTPTQIDEYCVHSPPNSPVFKTPNIQGRKYKTERNAHILTTYTPVKCNEPQHTDGDGAMTYSKSPCSTSLLNSCISPILRVENSRDVIPESLEPLFSGEEVSWTSSLATPFTQHVSWTNLNTEEKRVLLPSDGNNPRALFSPDLDNTTGCHPFDTDSDTSWKKTPVLSTASQSNTELHSKGHSLDCNGQLSNVKCLTREVIKECDLTTQQEHLICNSPVCSVKCSKIIAKRISGAENKHILEHCHYEEDKSLVARRLFSKDEDINVNKTVNITIETENDDMIQKANKSTCNVNSSDISVNLKACNRSSTTGILGNRDNRRALDSMNSDKILNKSNISSSHMAQDIFLDLSFNTLDEIFQTTEMLATTCNSKEQFETTNQNINIKNQHSHLAREKLSPLLNTDHKIFFNRTSTPLHPLTKQDDTHKVNGKTVITLLDKAVNISPEQNWDMTGKIGHNSNYSCLKAKKLCTIEKVHTELESSCRREEQELLCMRVKSIKALSNKPRRYLYVPHTETNTNILGNENQDGKLCLEDVLKEARILEDSEIAEMNQNLGKSSPRRNKLQAIESTQSFLPFNSLFNLPNDATPLENRSKNELYEKSFIDVQTSRSCGGSRPRSPMIEFSQKNCTKVDNVFTNANENLNEGVLKTGTRTIVKLSDNAVTQSKKVVLQVSADTESIPSSTLPNLSNLNTTQNINPSKDEISKNHHKNNLNYKVTSILNNDSKNKNMSSFMENEIVFNDSCSKELAKILDTQLVSEMENPELLFQLAETEDFNQWPIKTNNNCETLSHDTSKYTKYPNLFFKKPNVQMPCHLEPETLENNVIQTLSDSFDSNNADVLGENIITNEGLLLINDNINQKSVHDHSTHSNSTPRKQVLFQNNTNSFSIENYQTLLDSDTVSSFFNENTPDFGKNINSERSIDKRPSDLQNKHEAMVQDTKYHVSKGEENVAQQRQLECHSKNTIIEKKIINPNKSMLYVDHILKKNSFMEEVSVKSYNTKQSPNNVVELGNISQNKPTSILIKKNIILNQSNLKTEHIHPKDIIFISDSGLSGFSISNTKKVAHSMRSSLKAKQLFQKDINYHSKRKEQIFSPNIDKEVSKECLSKPKISLVKTKTSKSYNEVCNVSRDNNKLINDFNDDPTRDKLLVSQDKSLCLRTEISASNNHKENVSKELMHKKEKLYLNNKQNVGGNASTLLANQLCSENDSLKCDPIISNINKKKVSEELKEKDRQIYLNENTPNSKYGFRGFSPVNRHKVTVSGGDLLKTKDFALNSNLWMSGFSSASGLKVGVSEEALQKAKNMFIEEDKPKTKPDISEFSTASGLKVSVSEEALQKAKNMFIEEDKLKTKPDIFGFSTASGLKVSVSEEALQKAKKLLTEDDTPKSKSEILEYSITSEHKFNVPDKTIQKTKNMFSEDYISNSKHIYCEFPKPNVQHFIASNEPSVKSNKLSSFDNISKSEVRNCSFSTNIDENFPNISVTDLTQLFKKNTSHLKPIISDILRQKNVDKDLFYSCELEGKKNVISYQNYPNNNDHHSQLGIEMLSDSDLSAIKDVSTVQALENSNVKIVSSPVFEKQKYSHFKRQQNKYTRQGLWSSPIVDDVSESCSRRQIHCDTTACCLRKKRHGASSRLNQVSGCEMSLSQEVFESMAALMEDEEAAGPSWAACYVSYPDVLNDRCEAPKAILCSDIGDVDPPSPILGRFDRFSSRRHQESKRRLHFASTLQKPSSFKVPYKDTVAPSTIQPAKRMLKHAAFGTPFLKRSKLSHESENCSDHILSSEEVSCARQKSAFEQERIVETVSRGGQPRLVKGSHLLTKIREPQMSWRQAAGGRLPGTYSREQLLKLDIKEDVIDVTASNAVDYRFSAHDFYSSAMCRENVAGVPVGDGSMLILDSQGLAGVVEVTRAFLASPGVDPSLSSTTWVHNHYRWIVWKLAATERSFPLIFAHRCLSPNNVMLQLKYRYDREIDRSQRPALRKILEKDDTAAKRLVLCVARVVKAPLKSPVESKMETMISPRYELEVTDGWYGILASVDVEMCRLIESKIVTIGTKLMTHSAELLNCDQGCSPPEVGGEVRLKLHTNSTRRVRWDTKLGYYHHPGPLPISLSSVLPSGGLVSCVAVVLVRIYPTLYMEKTQEGRTVMRSERAEEHESALFERRRQEKAEQVYCQVQAEFNSKVSHISMKPSDVELTTLTSGEELCQFLDNSADILSSQSMLSVEQQETIERFRQEKQDRINKEMESKVREQMEAVNRIVTPLLKVRCMDPNNSECKRSVILTIWRATDYITTLLKEGTIVKLYNVNATGYKCKGQELQLTTSRQTKYEPLQQKVSYPERAVVGLKQLANKDFNPTFGEIDVVGVVVCNDSPQTVFLADADHSLLAVTFWGSAKELGYEDMLVPHSVVSASNLQWKHGNNLLPCVYATEMSTFSSHPRQAHLKEAWHTLRGEISVDLREFVSSCRDKLKSIVQQTNKVTTPVPYKASNSTSPLHQTRTSKLVTPLHRPLNNNAEEIKPPSAAERKLTKLELYGDPPPLSPLVLPRLRGTLRKEFKAPQRISHSPVHSETSPPLSLDSLSD